MTLAARRARNINAYFNQLGEGLGHMVPPQVPTAARKPLSIGFQEIAADKIRWADLPADVPAEDALDGDGRRRAERQRSHRDRVLIAGVRCWPASASSSG